MRLSLLFLFSFTYFFSTAQSQTELQIDAFNSYKKADKELNRVYQAIISEYSEDSVFIENLIISQRIWIQFRDAEFKMKYPDNVEYGSVQEMCEAMYLEKLTKERIKTLNVWLKGLEEGEVCSGSVKIK